MTSSLDILNALRFDHGLRPKRRLTEAEANAKFHGCGRLAGKLRRRRLAAPGLNKHQGRHKKVKREKKA